MYVCECVCDEITYTQRCNHLVTCAAVNRFTNRKKYHQLPNISKVNLKFLYPSIDKTKYSDLQKYRGKAIFKVQCSFKYQDDKLFWQDRFMRLFQNKNKEKANVKFDLTGRICRRFCAYFSFFSISYSSLVFSFFFSSHGFSFGSRDSTALPYEHAPRSSRHCCY